MNRKPLETIEQMAPSLMGHMEKCHDFTFNDGALPAKTKYLIAMAFDAAFGAVNGVRALAMEAKEHGASKEEVMEALSVALYLGGAGSVYTASQGLKDVF